MKAYLKRIVPKQPLLNQVGDRSSNQIDSKLSNQHDFLVLNKEKVFLGRSSKDCDLVLKPKIISRKHVLFTYSPLNKHWSIECLNNKNGVFVNGKLLKKNQAKKLEDNSIISFGPTFMTDFVYQFTSKESTHSSSKDQSIVSISSSSSSDSQIDLVTDLTDLTKTKQLQKSPAKESSFGKIMQRVNNLKSFDKKVDFEMITDDQLKVNSKRIKLLNARVKHLEEKVNNFKLKTKVSRLKLKRVNNKLKVYQTATSRQKMLLKNAKHCLSRERTKKKELQKQLANQISLHKVQMKKDDSAVDNVNNLSNDDKSGKIVKKYNELFSEDFTCGVCLELFLEPVSATCGHSFCKFCISQWLERNQNVNKRECPLCRNRCKGYFKNILIENIIEKHLVNADKEVLETRNRLIKEREKVLASSKNDNRNNFDLNAISNQVQMIRYHGLFADDMSDYSDVEGDILDEDLVYDIDDDQIDYEDDYSDDEADEIEGDEIESFDISLE